MRHFFRLLFDDMSSSDGIVLHFGRFVYEMNFCSRSNGAFVESYLRLDGECLSPYLQRHVSPHLPCLNRTRGEKKNEERIRLAARKTNTQTDLEHHALLS